MRDHFLLGLTGGGLIGRIGKTAGRGRIPPAPKLAHIPWGQVVPPQS